MPKNVSGSTKRTVTETTVSPQGENPPDPVEVAQSSPQNEAFFEMLSEIPPADWESRHLSVTVYRREPPLDPQRPDRAGYAFKKQMAFDEGFVAARYGGGVYEYWYKEAGRLVSRGHFVIGGAPKAPAQWDQPETPGAVASVPGASGEKGGDLVTVLKDLIDKQSSGASIEQMQQTFRHAQEIMKETYSASLKSMAERNPEGDLLDRMIKLGVIKTGGQNSLLETIETLKALGLVGEQKEDLIDQIEKIKSIGEVLGWSRGGSGGGGDDDWRVSLARNLPDVLSGVERVTLNIVSAIQQAKGTAPAIPPGNPPAQPPATKPGATQPPQGITPEAQQATLDSFIKTKLVEFFERRPGKAPDGDEVTAEEVVTWLEWTAKPMIDYLSNFSADVVIRQISADPILQRIAQESDGRAWIEALLLEMKAEPVGT